MSAVLLWALPGRGRRDPLLWLLVAAAIAGCLVVLVGNVRVVGAWGAVLATVLVAGLLWLRRLASAKVVVAAAVSLVVPHFVALGAGMVVLAVAAAAARPRGLRRAGSRKFSRSCRFWGGAPPGGSTSKGNQPVRGLGAAACHRGVVRGHGRWVMGD